MSNPSSNALSPEVVAGLTKTLDSLMDKTITAIDSVNDQIRVLALNARIEAARAGDAGKAFNIVAMEIASLSNSSTNVVANLKKRSRRALSSISSASKNMATSFHGTRLADLAQMNINLVDRNLYERTCDVRWLATESSLVNVLADSAPEKSAMASRRLQTILESYTVYSDLILCNMQGQVIAHGRPDLFRAAEIDCARTTWFDQAIKSRSGAEFGFEGVHRCPLVNNRLALIYSCAVREGGEKSGSILGVLGVVFDWEKFAKDIVGEGISSSEDKRPSRIAIVDKLGQVLADSDNRELEDVIDFTDRARLFASKKGSVITTMDGQEYFVGHAASTGYETYATGWHALCIQACELEKSAADEEEAQSRRRARRSSSGRPIRRRRKVSEA